ncbi:hypothetical protein HETIRDRAFT_445270, partial [Heterobasidion irregulare TC 32-1]
MSRVWGPLHVILTAQSSVVDIWANHRRRVYIQRGSYEHATRTGKKFPEVSPRESEWSRSGREWPLSVCFWLRMAYASSFGIPKNPRKRPPHSPSLRPPLPPVALRWTTFIASLASLPKNQNRSYTLTLLRTEK